MCLWSTLWHFLCTRVVNGGFGLVSCKYCISYASEFLFWSFESRFQVGIHIFFIYGLYILKRVTYLVFQLLNLSSLNCSKGNETKLLVSFN